jgi:hypothetical protein
MKFNTEITVVQPATGERTKWQGPQIEADTIQEAEKAAFASIMYVSGENVPREQLSVLMQPPRSLALVAGCDECQIPESIVHKILYMLLDDWAHLELNEKACSAILRAIGCKVFNPLDPETIRMRNENLFHPDFVSKLDEAESIGGVVISYLPEV